MSSRSRCVLCLAVVSTLLLALAGCGSASSRGVSAAPVEKLTSATLPTQPGTTWTVAHYSASQAVPIDLRVEGPWTIEAQEGWRMVPSEIVEATGTPQISRFQEVGYVVKTAGDAGADFYVRGLTDKWVLQLGEIRLRGDQAEPSVSTTPTQFWPLDFEVGDEFLVSDTETFTTNVEVLARSTATVPAGVIENTYLLRYTYVSKVGAAKSGTYYYLLAPNVGFVALIQPSAGDEKTGFTAARQVDVLSQLPRTK